MNVGFLGLLSVVFITLKLVGTITWSWWWVTAPLWGGIALWLLVVAILSAMAARNKLW